MLVNKGYKLFATGGTHKTFAENGIESTLVYWPSEEGHPQALEMLHNKEIDMVVNIPKNLTAGELDNGYKIRRVAIDLKRAVENERPSGKMHLSMLSVR